MTEPTKHPGDFAWRLPLIRTLQQSRAVTQEQTDEANAAAKTDGLFVSHLAAAGLSETKLLVAWGRATGLPTASPMVLRKPPKTLSTTMTAELALALLAVPFEATPELRIAFAVPLPADLTAKLPPHVAHVALEKDVRLAIEYLWPGSTAPIEESQAPVRLGNPTDADFKRAGIVLTEGPSRSEMNGPAMKKAAKIGAAVLAVLLVVRTGMWLIDRANNEVERKSAELSKGLVESQKEAAVAQAPPPPTAGPDVASAVQLVDLALSKEEAGAFAKACRTLSDALATARLQTTNTIQMSDFTSLFRETALMCEQDHLRPRPEVWADLKSRIIRVINGETPVRALAPRRRSPRR